MGRSMARLGSFGGCKHRAALPLEGIVASAAICPTGAKNKKRPAMLRVKEAFELDRQRDHACAL